MKLLKEPLFHFLLLGLTLFLVYGWKARPTSSTEAGARAVVAQIVVSQNDVHQMNNLFEKTWQRTPTEEVQKGLIEDFIRNEIYYREAIAIGLDREDEVLKRRLRLKMEFIFEDISLLTEPTDEELRAFMMEHQNSYRTGLKISFEQIYISASKRGENAEVEARRVITQLKEGIDPSSVGDTTLLESKLPLTALEDIAKQFGDPFSKKLIELTPGEWSGPILSEFGLHLVHVKERQEQRLLDISEVREIVKRDWMVERQKNMKNDAYAKIRERYAVTVEPPKSEEDVAAAAKTRDIER